MFVFSKTPSSFDGDNPGRVELSPLKVPATASKIVKNIRKEQYVLTLQSHF